MLVQFLLLLLKGSHFSWVCASADIYQLLISAKFGTVQRIVTQHKYCHNGEVVQKRNTTRGGELYHSIILKSPIQARQVW